METGNANKFTQESNTTLAARIDRFIEGDSDNALRELAATAPILEALFLRYSVAATQAKELDRKYRLTKLALQCQASFARTLALIAGLKQQRKGKATVIVHDDVQD